MLSFNFRATSPKGERVANRVEAESVKAAIAQLEQRGYSAIQLLDDETSAVKINDPSSRRRLQFSTREEEALRRKKTFAGRTLWSFGKSWWIWGPLLAWLGLAWWRSGWASPALPAALLLTFVIWFAWATVPSVFYEQALQASVWCRWREVERWMGWMARWQYWFKTPMPEHELLFRTATAMAGQGRLDEGLRRVAPLARDTRLAPGFYQARLASLYFAAKDFATMARLQEEARMLNPSPSSVIDLATTQARWLGDAKSAQKLLAGVDVKALPPSAQAFFGYCQGVIALAQGQPVTAAKHLAEALESARAIAGVPLVQSLVLDARAHYGLALAAMGRPDEAKPHLNAAYPLLKAREDVQLIARCKAAYLAAKQKRP